jgi:hypothetical protein
MLLVSKFKNGLHKKSYKYLSMIKLQLLANSISGCSQSLSAIQCEFKCCYVVIKEAISMLFKENLMLSKRDTV